MQQEARHRWVSSSVKTLPTTTTTIVETLDSFPYQTLNNNNNNSSSSFCLPLTIMSNGRDRTSEFQTTVRTFASRRVRIRICWILHKLFFENLEWPRWSSSNYGESSSTSSISY
jgi:hypothetical protein